MNLDLNDATPPDGRVDSLSTLLSASVVALPFGSTRDAAGLTGGGGGGGLRVREDVFVRVSCAETVALAEGGGDGEGGCGDGVRLPLGGGGAGLNFPASFKSGEEGDARKTGILRPSQGPDTMRFGSKNCCCDSCLRSAIEDARILPGAL